MVLADLEEAVFAMNGDIQSARRLLADLRTAYRGLPRHVQVRVARLLRLGAIPPGECRSTGEEPSLGTRTEQ